MKPCKLNCKSEPLEEKEKGEVLLIDPVSKVRLNFAASSQPSDGGDLQTQSAKLRPIKVIHLAGKS